MTLKTVTQSGPISDAATFGGSAFVDRDDIAYGNFTLTIDQNSIVGHSPNDTTTKVLAGGVSGRFKVNDAVKITVCGNADMPDGDFNNETFQMGLGSEWQFDNSLSGGNPVYQLTATFARFQFVGDATHRGKFGSIPGTTFAIVTTGLYHTTQFALQLAFYDFPGCSTPMWNVHSASGLSVTDCTFPGCGTVAVVSGGGFALGCVWDRNKITASTAAVNALSFDIPTTGSNRSLAGNSIDKAVQMGADNFAIENNVIGGGIDYLAGVGHLRRRGNVIFSDGLLNSGNGQRVGGGVTREHLVIENAIGNGHWLSPYTTGGVDAVYDQLVFEIQFPDLIDTGDCLIVNNGATAGGGKIVGRNCIVLAGADGASAQLLTLFNNATSVTRWFRNTVFAGLSAAIGKRGAFAFAEGGDGAAGQLELLAGNIGWAAVAGGGYIGEKVVGAVLDHIVPGGCDKNHAWNLSAGNNGRSYANHAVNANIWTLGNAAAAGADNNQTTGDPQFVAFAAVGIAAWSTARGYGASYAAGKAALLADPTRGADLLDFDFAAMSVQSSALRTAYLGTPKGAANFHDSTRTGAGLAAAKALLAPHLAA